jgi:hypothetical protein
MNTYIEQFKAFKAEIERNKNKIRNLHSVVKHDYLETQPDTRTLTFKDYPQHLQLRGHDNTLLTNMHIPNYLQPFLEQAIANNILTLLDEAAILADEERKRLARNAAQEYADLLCESDE